MTGYSGRRAGIFNCMRDALKRNEPAGIGDILKKMVQTTSLGKELEKARIVESWADVAGPYLSQHGRPATIKDGTLTIDADSPVWMHKYSYRKWDIIRRANRLAGKELISDVFVRLAPDDNDRETE